MMSANSTSFLAASPLKNEDHPIIKYISEVINLTAEEKQIIFDSLNEKVFKKGTQLLREGDISCECFFLLKGVVRQYYLVDGEEKTTFFYTDGEPVFTLNNTDKRNPSKYYLECLEDCIISIGDESKEEEMFKKNPRFEKVCRVKMEEIAGGFQQMLATYITSTPEERYLNILEKRPELLHRVPQYQLASYIGVKPESLSRIRKRLLRRA